MPIPKDQDLYENTRRDIYRKYPTHSAYRSGQLVKEYKRRFAEIYGAHISPYIGARPRQGDPGLRRWFAEKWTNQRGEVGYARAGDIYRPNVRISPRTPLTFKELSPARIGAARREKIKHNRVRRF